MIINTLGDLVVDDDWLETLSTEELTAWLTSYIQTNFDPEWGIKLDDPVWVCPLTNRLISFGGVEPDWRAQLNI